MKKLLFSSALMGISGMAWAQLPVSTAPQTKKVVLEEFTGIHCQYCPDGHKRANDLKDSRSAGDVVLINVHTGGYATPGSGEPDFRTSAGNSIANISGMNIAGYPAGSVNRHLFSGESGMSVNRGRWSAYADQILSESSYVNVALEGYLDSGSRKLVIAVEAYYTGSSTATTNKLTVVLMEDTVKGPQTGATTWYPEMVNPDGTYNHNHVLRKVLTTAATGEAIEPTASGTLIRRTYSYDIPATFVNTTPKFKNLHLAAFIAESDKEIITAAYGPIKYVPTSVSDVNRDFSEISLYPNPTSQNAQLSFHLNSASRVAVTVLDATGRTVVNVADQQMNAGDQKVQINTNTLAAGIYNVVIKTEKGAITQRLAVVR